MDLSVLRIGGSSGNGLPGIAAVPRAVVRLCKTDGLARGDSVNPLLPWTNRSFLADGSPVVKPSTGNAVPGEAGMRA